MSTDLIYDEWNEEDKKMYGSRYDPPEEEDISLKLLGTLISVILNNESLTYSETCKEIKNVLIKNNIYYEPK